jgi:hypothetical protein
MTLNEKAQRLLELKSLIASLEKEKKMIEDEFKEKGSFSTQDFDVVVAETTRYYAKGVDALIEAFGEAAVLEKEVVAETTYKVVRVVAKRDKGIAA